MNSLSFDSHLRLQAKCCSRKKLDSNNEFFLARCSIFMEVFVLVGVRESNSRDSLRVLRKREKLNANQKRNLPKIAGRLLRYKASVPRVCLDRSHRGWSDNEKLSHGTSGMVGVPFLIGRGVIASLQNLEHPLYVWTVPYSGRNRTSDLSSQSNRGKHRIAHSCGSGSSWSWGCRNECLMGLGWVGRKGRKKRFASLRFCVSSLHRDHANLLCIVKRLFNARAETRAHNGAKKKYIYSLQSRAIKTLSREAFRRTSRKRSFGSLFLLSRRRFLGVLVIYLLLPGGKNRSCQKCQLSFYSRRLNRESATRADRRWLSIAHETPQGEDIGLANRNIFSATIALVQE